jgi:hypothetical protein
VDPTGSLCAIKLGGWAPRDLLLHGGEEAARDRAEGERLAYVAATRARDVLVVPAIGDEVFQGGWLDPLMPAIYPPEASRRQPSAAAGCPSFASKDTVINRPDGDPARKDTVAPGAYTFGAAPAQAGSREGSHSVVWWDPHVLHLDAQSTFGLRRDDLIAKDGDPEGVASRMAAFQQWQSRHAATLARASEPSVRSVIATAAAGDRTLSLVDAADAAAIEVLRLGRTADRPFGARFGTLVHAILATVPLDADGNAVRRVAESQARLIHGSGEGLDEEAYAAAEAVMTVLRHPLFGRVRAAAAAGRCHRELPVIWLAPDGLLVEGTVDLAFEEAPAQGSGAPDGAQLIVLDFKTDRELDDDLDRYRKQVAIYCRALASLKRCGTRGIIMGV